MRFSTARVAVLVSLSLWAVEEESGVSLQAQSYTVTTFAGVWQQGGSADGTLSTARFAWPTGVAVDRAGNLFVADSHSHTIRKITPAGMVSTLAGSAGNSGFVDAVGSAARFSLPQHVAVDSAGNVYVTDEHDAVRKITPTGVVSTFAGSTRQADSWGSADGTGTAARFNSPSGVAVDGAGNVYVADRRNSTLRKITPAGVVSTLAGTAGSRGSADGIGSAARFNYPVDVTVDSAGNIYVADGAIRKVTPAGVVTTLAGLSGSPGSADGTGSAARFSALQGVTVDDAGNVFVSDTGNHTLRKITPAGVVTTLAGLAGRDGFADGTGSAARFSYPRGLAVDRAGIIYIADEYNTILRKADAAAAPTITTQPQSQDVITGGSTTLNVAATSMTPMTYQWRLNGSTIAGATSSSLALTNLQTGGSYTGVVTNAAGPTTSDAALVTVNGAAKLSAPSGTPFGTQFYIMSDQFLGARLTVPTAATITAANVEIASTTSGSFFVVVVPLASLSALPRGTPAQGIPFNAGEVAAYAAFSPPAGYSGNYSVPLNYRAAPGVYAIVFGTGLYGTSGSISMTGYGPVGINTYFFWSSVPYRWQDDNESCKIGLDLLVETTPRITMQPAATPVTAGRPVSLSVAATGGNLSYQWQLNGAVIPGATNATLDIAATQPSAVGDYSVVVKNSAGSVSSSVAGVGMVAGRLVNLSVLTSIAAGDPLIVGAVIGGKGVRGTLPLLVRGAGPSLTQLDVVGALADPRLDVYSGTNVVAGNDHWGGSSALSTFAASVGAFPFSSATSKDAALAFGPEITAPPVSYTVHLNSGDGSAGIGLAELYDGFPPSLVGEMVPRLVNMSARKQIPADGLLIAGFVVGGTTPKQLLIRAIGPRLGLAPFDIAGAMPDPKLTLYDATRSPIAANDDWGGGATLTAAFASIGAFALPADSRDAAVLVTLAPGAYTAHIAPTARSKGGVALVEVYDLEGGAAPVISGVPAGVTVLTGAQTELSVSAIGGVGYQWQRLPAGSSTWLNLTDDANSVGSGTPSLLLNAGVTQNGDRFRVVVTNSSGVSYSTAITLAVSAAPTAISVAASAVPQIQPFALINIDATGLTPGALTYVEFRSSSGALLANVPPMLVSARTITIAAPPLLGPDGITLSSGAISARIVQRVNGQTILSNTFTAAQVQAGTPSRVRAGLLALSLIQADLSLTRDLLAGLGGADVDSAPTRDALNNAIATLQRLATNLQRATTDSTFTFSLGPTANPVVVTQRDLQVVDNFLLAHLQAVPGSSSTAISPARLGRVLAGGANGIEDEATKLAKAASDGEDPQLLLNGAMNYVYKPRATVGGAMQVAINTFDRIFGGSVATAGIAMSVAGSAVSSLTAGTAALLAAASGNTASAMGLGAMLGQAAAADREAVRQKLVELTAPLTTFLPWASANSPFTNAVAATALGNTARDAAYWAAGLKLPTYPVYTLRTGVILDTDLAATLGSGTVVAAPPGRSWAPTESDVLAGMDARYSTDANLWPIRFGAPRSYSAGDPVDITACPVPGSVVRGWILRPNGPLSAEGKAAIGITMNTDREIAAVFGLPFKLTLQTTGSGSGTIVADPPARQWPAASGLTDYLWASGQSVSLKAKADTGSFFAGWSGEATGLDNPTWISVDKNKTITAAFVRGVTVNVIISALGTGSGTVELTPPGGTYKPGQQVTITAKPVAGSTVTWGGAVSGSALSQPITVSENLTITATFNATPPTTCTLTTKTDGTGSGTIKATPSKTSYTLGETVRLDAVESTGSTFIKWSGLVKGDGDTESGKTATVVMKQSKAVTATFNLASTGGVARFDGYYTGDYSGTTTAWGYTRSTSGSVALTVSGGGVTVTSPGSGRGTVDSAGAAKIGVGASDGVEYTFTGTFSVANGVATGDGSWRAEFDGGSGSGRWSVRRR